ncbi:MAG: NAD(P)/FAD-dependent oxidoreductase [Tepidisphaeraceae bacterium]
MSVPPLETQQAWDAVVIGAGPAGGVSATMLARHGWRVLLVDRSTWPREKVCGGCVNASAVRMLRDAGLGEIVRGRPTLNRCLIRSGGRAIEVPLPAGAAVDRRTFDAALVNAFQSAGGVWVPAARATLLPADAADHRQIVIQCDGASHTVRAGLVLACDGIGGTSLRDEPWAAWRVAPAAWFGVAARLPADALACAAGRIEMHVGRGGYVGTVREASGREAPGREASGTIHLAAALNPARCKAVGGPERMVEQILQQCGHAMTTPGTLRFTGTGLLTRRRTRLAGMRVMAVGDACGYVEPFTGEGIAWAIRSAVEAAAFAVEQGSRWTDAAPAAWEARHRRAVRRQQRACRVIRGMLHRPLLAHSGIALGSMLPPMARAMARWTQSHALAGTERFA